MAQLTGTAGRPTSHTPAAFIAGTLFAVATIATVVILALALGLKVEVRDDATAAQAGAVAPASTYDGRLDPIEAAYIQGARTGAASAPLAGVASDDGRLDPIEQAYIDGAHVGMRAGAVSVPTGSPSIEQSLPRSGQPRTQLVPR
jgi:hypothetical protein